MEKKVLFTAVFISTLLLSWVVGTQLFNLGKANPHIFVDDGEVSPPSDVNPPTIIISSPKNSTVYSVNSASLTFKVIVIIPTLPELFYYYLGLSEVYYKASWLSNNTYLDLEAVKNSIPPPTRTFSNDSVARWNTHWTLSGYVLSPSFSVNVTGLPKGSHSLEVFAVLRGSRGTSRSGITYHYGRYSLVGSSVVNFTVDSPSILSPQSKTYDTSDVPLLFNVPESVTQTSYSLDGQETVIVAGNTTLTGLSNGEHNVTVYATDNAGNIGASETITFTIAEPEPEPFPTPLVIAPIASVAFVGAGLLVYFKKRQR